MNDGAKRMLANLIAEHNDDVRFRMYRDGWRHASTMLDDDPPIPISPNVVPLDHLVRIGDGTGSAHCWTVKPDVNGEWWSFRIRYDFSCPMAERGFDLWRPHARRAAARSWARAEAKSERDRAGVSI